MLDSIFNHFVARVVVLGATSSAIAAGLFFDCPPRAARARIHYAIYYYVGNNPIAFKHLGIESRRAILDVCR